DDESMEYLSWASRISRNPARIEQVLVCITVAIVPQNLSRLSNGLIDFLIFHESNQTWADDQEF
ncbi:MAG: hypothetical protein AAFR31_21560, partial [Cyanobacteria bacterium J06627_8]